MNLNAWGLPEATTEPIEGGYNSLTWNVYAGENRYVAKRVGGERATFEAGLIIAEWLEARGFQAGGPVRTRDGGLTIPSEGEWLALLHYVPGEPVTPDTREGLEIWGRMMGRAHALLVDVPPPDTMAQSGGGVDLDAPYLDIAPWLRPALRSATEEVGRITGLTYGIIHNDGCEPRRDPVTGELSVIDWGAAGYGPLVSDIGTSRWQFQAYGNRRAEEFAPFLDAYLTESPIDPGELAHIDTFVRLRAAMSGWYFAWRIHAENTTGADAGWNHNGLEHARQFWEALHH